MICTNCLDAIKKKISKWDRTHQDRYEYVENCESYPYPRRSCIDIFASDLHQDVHINYLKKFIAENNSPRASTLRMRRKEPLKPNSFQCNEDGPIARVIFKEEEKQYQPACDKDLIGE